MECIAPTFETELHSVTVYTCVLCHVLCPNCFLLVSIYESTMNQTMVGLQRIAMQVKNCGCGTGFVIEIF